MSTPISPPRTARRSLYGRRRWAFRTAGLAFAAALTAFLFFGVRAHFVLPECDSQVAKKTLSQVLKAMQREPLRFAPIKTIASTKDKVVCNATVPLKDGSTILADYAFTWQGRTPNMSYSIRHIRPPS